MSAFTINYRDSKQQCYTVLDDTAVPVTDVMTTIMEASKDWPINHEALQRLAASQLAVDNRRAVRLMIEKAVPDLRLRLWIRFSLFPIVFVVRVISKILKLGRI